jgi:hypothetical protein
MGTRKDKSGSGDDATVTYRAGTVGMVNSVVIRCLENSTFTQRNLTAHRALPDGDTRGLPAEKCDQNFIGYRREKD